MICCTHFNQILFFEIFFKMPFSLSITSLQISGDGKQVIIMSTSLTSSFKEFPIFYSLDLKLSVIFLSKS